MSPIKIGNWLVTDEGISWSGANEYFIDKDRLLETGPGNRSNMYDWLVHLPEKSWLDVEDIFTLNTAFIYAINYFELDLNQISFVETIIEQQKQLNLKK
jgi:hypothetical protein